MSEAQKIADTLATTLTGKDPGLHIQTCNAAASELRRLDDLLGKANALARIRAERLQTLESDPAYDYCHRLAIMLECMTLNADRNFDAACALIDEYNTARNRWAESQGQPYVSGFGKN